VAKDGGDYGLALLTTWSLERLEQRMLPVPAGREPRTVGRAVLSHGGTTISVYFTHLSVSWLRPAIRDREAQAILGWMAGDPNPKILLGDLNSTDRARAVRRLTRELTDVLALAGEPEATFRWPGRGSGVVRMDYVFVDRRFRALRSTVVHCDASDHFPVVADLLLLPPNRQTQRLRAQRAGSAG
jgi:endonuclease/exonuclease/phosphatase family metal-dependent hydrolase